MVAWQMNNNNWKYKAFKQLPSILEN